MLLPQLSAKPSAAVRTVKEDTESPDMNAGEDTCIRQENQQFDITSFPPSRQLIPGANSLPDFTDGELSEIRPNPRAYSHSKERQNKGCRSYSPKRGEKRKVSSQMATFIWKAQKKQPWRSLEHSRKVLPFPHHPIPSLAAESSCKESDPHHGWCHGGGGNTWLELSKINRDKCYQQTGNQGPGRLGDSQTFLM